MLVHAIMDAMLGAAALGDIGHLFPDSDDKYKNADSMKLLAEVCRVCSDAGYILGNMDSTIIAQSPKLAPYINLMRENIADVCGCNVSQISVKATTEEKLGFTGDGSGISAHCTVLLVER